jgi:hypothetical protein
VCGAASRCRHSCGHPNLTLDLHRPCRGGGGAD